MGDEFVLGEFERIEESTHRRLAITPAPLMLSFIVVLVEPRIKVCLQGGVDSVKQHGRRVSDKWNERPHLPGGRR